jgi:hypothetical protein
MRKRNSSFRCFGSVLLEKALVFSCTESYGTQSKKEEHRFFVCFVALGFELRALQLLSRRSTT